MHRLILSSNLNGQRAMRHVDWCSPRATKADARLVRFRLVRWLAILALAAVGLLAPAPVTAAAEQRVGDKGVVGAGAPDKAGLEGYLESSPDERVPQGAPGTLDPSFSGDGKASYLFDLGGGNGDFGQEVAIQADGKIVVVGYAEFTAPDDDFAVLRLLPDGTLDPTFSGDGKGTYFFDLGDTNADRAFTVAIQPDGKIVVAGSAAINSGISGFAVLRLWPDGSLDAGFGTGGLAVLPIGTGLERAQAVAIQTDGKIVLAGSAWVSGLDFGVVRLTANGFLDPSFGGDGKVTVGFDLGGNLFDEARDLAIQPNGRIVLVGSAQGSDGIATFAFVRLLTNGSLDSSFSGDGKATFNIPQSFGEAVALHPGGEILAVGTFVFGSSDTAFALVQLESNGNLDLDFGGGVRFLEFSPLEHSGSDVVIQSDGRAVVLGSAQSSAQNWEFAAARFNTDGLLDASFGTDGMLVVPFDIAGLEDRAYGAAMQADDKIVVVGSAEFISPDFDFAVMRLDGGAPIFLDGFESGDTSAWSVSVP